VRFRRQLDAGRLDCGEPSPTSPQAAVILTRSGKQTATTFSPLHPHTGRTFDLYIPTENEANGIIATISTLIGTAIGGVVGFVIDPENRWIVQLAVTVTSSFVLFGLGKGVDIYLKVKFGKHNDR
jgi:hypothetical protein